MSISVDARRAGVHPHVWEMLHNDTTVKVASGFSTFQVTDRFTLPADSLKVGDILGIGCIIKAGVVSGAPANFFARMYLNNSEAVTASMNAVAGTNYELRNDIIVTGQTSQISRPFQSKINTGLTTAMVNFAEDIGGPINVDMNMNFNDVLQEITQYRFYVEVLRA